MRFSRTGLQLLLLITVALAMGSAQTVTIVSGNGQVAGSFLTTKTGFDPLVVRVVDSAGRPVANTSVNWTISSTTGFPGSLESAQTVTDANGQSSNRYFGYNLINVGFAPYAQDVITASVGSSSVQFTETQELINQSSPTAGGITVSYEGTVLSGPAGGVGTAPLTVIVRSTQLGTPVPGVAVRLTTDDDPSLNLPTVSCQGQAGQPLGTVVTDANGTATCNPIFGSRVGTEGTYRINVGGGWKISQPFNFSVTIGAAGAIQILRGNNQNVGAGGVLAAPLVAQVTDLGGNPVGNVDVVWSVTPAGAAELFNTRQTSAADGQVSANVRNVTGPAQVRVALASNSNIGVTFTINAPPVNITGLNKSSGDNQDAGQNSAFPNAIAVQAVAGGQPVAGVTVAFAVTSGSATLSAPSATTNAQGIASVNVTAGPNTGPVVITATAGSFTQTFNLTVRPPGPAFTSESFFNGFSFLRASDPSGGISPCSIATIVASGIAPGLQGTIAPSYFGALPYQINRTTVTINDRPAPLFGVSNINGQESITLQVPCEVTPGNATVVISVAGSSRTGTVNIRNVSPGILEAIDADGRTRAVLVRADGTFVNPSTNPARRGDIVRAYATGLGPTLPIMSTNAVPVPGSDSVPTGGVIVGVNNAGVRVVSVKAAANLVGVYEIAFEIPNDVPAGDLPFSIDVTPQGTQTRVFSKGSTISVQ